ncbi:hypothetical protein EUX98_g7879 [Antrodiella citrinella]|uniref:Uncharacterized protein n=1 Tax=Antrodiella citrinella TaxID=2447956 RepID=A0A4S4MKF4_9APHY|nr:hypothetical protein EUX98_g7879 [Antrodiella citrinella]
MADDERAAKAARARAMLKKRQQQKVAGVGCLPESAQIQNLLDKEREQVKTLQTELQRIQGDVTRLVSRHEEQQSVIATLTTDKASLTTKAENASAELKRTEGLLHEERESVKGARASIERMQSDLGKASKQVQEQQRRISSLESEGTTLKATSQQELSQVRALVGQLEQHLSAERETSTVYREQVQELEASIDEQASRSEQQQQTISFLVSEKTALTSQVVRLQSAESDLTETSKLLEVERSRAERLQGNVHQLETQSREYSARVDELSTKERELTDKTRDQERDLKLLNGTAAELRSQANNYQRRVRELEEQIESDDRAERLEATLQHTQDRAAELEFQVSKLKQAQGTLKTERDELEGRLRAQAQTESTWQNRHAEVEKQYSTTKEQLSSIASERDTLQQEKSALQLQVEESRTSFSELQQKLSQTAAELTTSVRALQQVQTELRNANRRADEAEQIQKDLRGEGLVLMRSLDEMRPKIVELTDVKLDLGEKVASLEKAVHSRDATIAQLESNLDELRDQFSDLEKEHQQVNAALQRERSSSNDNASELQKAYADLQNELQGLRASVKHLEEERAEYRNMANRNMEEVDRLSAALQTANEQVSALRAEIVERSDARHEAQEFLEHAREEMEVLRMELAAKDSEIERLQEAAESPSEATGDGGLHSWDEEVLSSVQQQHALEISAAQSEIRHLETVVFQAEAKAHALQKQLSATEDHLAHYRPSSRGPAPRTTSRVGITDEIRRSSFGSHRPSPGVAPSSDFDGLSAETRHKRKVSLSMLKARIDSEAAVNKSKGMSPAVKLAALPSVAEHDVDSSRTSSRSSPVIVNSARRAPQFLDDSHVFWCSSCRGDLVVL